MWDSSFLNTPFKTCHLQKKMQFTVKILGVGEMWKKWPHLGLSEEQIIVMQGFFSTHHGVCCL